MTASNPIQMHAGRRDMARELGQKTEALRVAAHDESRRNEGAIGALKHAEEACQGQIPHWKTMAANGEIDAEVAQAYRDRIEDCCGVLRNLRLAAEQNLVAQRGKLAQAESVLDACQEAFDYEGKAIEQVMQALADAEAGTIPADDEGDGKQPRKVGQKPPAPIAARRRKEADA